MEKKKALAYKKFVSEAENAFERIVTEKENMDKKELARLKRKFLPDEFENMHLDFEEELKENIGNYNNNFFITTLLKVTFSDVCRYAIRKNGVVDAIIRDGIEVEFLLKLYKNINEATEFFNFLCEVNVENALKSLNSYLNELVQPVKKTNAKEADKGNDMVNPQFVFENLKKEIENPAIPNQEKYNIVHHRLYDFLQWQKEFDTADEWHINSNESKYQITRKLYPKFEALCELEKKRLSELIKPDIISQPPPKTPSVINIASKKKTEVIKILSAMYDLKLFTDTNGKPLTNKQKMMDAFGEFLNEDYASYSTFLTQAKGRDYDNFLKIFDELKAVSKNYIEKE